MCLVLVPASVLCLCRADRTMPIGALSLNQDTARTSHSTMCRQGSSHRDGSTPYTAGATGTSAAQTTKPSLCHRKTSDLQHCRHVWPWKHGALVLGPLRRHLALEPCIVHLSLQQRHAPFKQQCSLEGSRYMFRYHRHRRSAREAADGAYGAVERFQRGRTRY